MNLKKASFIILLLLILFLSISTINAQEIDNSDLSINDFEDNIYEIESDDVNSKLSWSDSDESLSDGNSTTGGDIIIINVDISALTSPWSSGRSSGIFAGVDNNLTVTVNNNVSEFNDITIEIYSNESDGLIGSYVGSLPEGSSKIVINDPTIRDITADTVWPEAQNNKILYTVFVKSGNIIFGEKSFEKIVAYNGYLNKTYAYGGVSNKINRNYTINGDIIVASQPTEMYMDQFSRQRNETWDISLPKGSTLVKAFLYFNYNWDTSYFPDGWKLTFNGNEITEDYIFWDKDRGNLGGWGAYEYGIQVYDVSSYFTNGENVFNITKTGNCALYPSTLVVLYNVSKSSTLKDVYFSDICDVLYNFYNMGYTGLTNVYVPFNGINVTNLKDAEWYVFAGSADGSNDGNISFNNKMFTNLWDENGTIESCFAYVANVTDVIGKNNDAWYLTDLKKMTTVVVYEQILVVTKSIKVPKSDLKITVSAKDITHGKDLSVRVKLSADVSRRATVTVGNETQYVSLTDGVGTVKFSGLNVGTYTVLASYGGDEFYNKASANTTVTVSKGTPSIKVTAKAIAYGEDLTVEVTMPADVTRRPSVVVDGESKYVTLKNGSGSVKFSGLGVGVHNIEVTYTGDSNYLKASLNKTVRVNKATASFKITAKAITYGDNLVVEIKGPSDLSRRVSVSVANQTKYVTLKNGSGSVKFSGLTPALYTIDVSYSGDDNYKKSTANKTVRVNKATPQINIVTKDIKVGETLNVDVKMPADVSRRVTVKVGDQSKMLSLNNGSGTVKFTNLQAGSYNVSVSYGGDSLYKATTKTTKINVKNK